MTLKKVSVCHIRGKQGSWGHRVGLDREEQTLPVLLSDRAIHATYMT